MKTTKTVQSILLDEMNSLISGKSDIKRAKTITKISAQLIYATRLELENKRIEVEIAKAPDAVQTWLSKDFSSIQSIKIGE